MKVRNDLILLTLANPLSTPLINNDFSNGEENWEITKINGIGERYTIDNRGFYNFGGPSHIYSIKQSLTLKKGSYLLETLTFVSITPNKVEVRFNGETKTIDYESPTNNKYKYNIEEDGEYEIEFQLFGNTRLNYYKLTPTSYKSDKVEIDDEFDYIPLTIAQNDIKDPSKLKSNHSKTINLPPTDYNNKLFGNIYRLEEINNYKLNSPVGCILLQNNEKVFEGYFSLIKVKYNIDDKIIGYEGLLFSQITTLFDDMGSNLLIGNEKRDDDLDFSEYIFTVGKDDIEKSMTPYNSNDPNVLNYLPGRGVIHSPIDKEAKTLHYLLEAPTHFAQPDVYRGEEWMPYNFFRTNKLSPTLYIKEIFDKILEKYGYTYQSDFLNSDYFKSLITPLTEPELIRKDTENLIEETHYGIHKSMAIQDYNSPLSWTQFRTNILNTQSFSNNEIKNINSELHPFNQITTFSSSWLEPRWFRINKKETKNITTHPFLLFHYYDTQNGVFPGFDYVLCRYGDIPEYYEYSSLYTETPSEVTRTPQNSYTLGEMKTGTHKINVDIKLNVNMIFAIEHFGYNTQSQLWNRSEYLYQNGAIGLSERVFSNIVQRKENTPPQMYSKVYLYCYSPAADDFLHKIELRSINMTKQFSHTVNLGETGWTSSPTIFNAAKGYSYPNHPYWVDDTMVLRNYVNDGEIEIKFDGELTVADDCEWGIMIEGNIRNKTIDDKSILYVRDRSNYQKKDVVYGFIFSMAAPPSISEITAWDFEPTPYRWDGTIPIELQAGEVTEDYLNTIPSKVTIKTSKYIGDGMKFDPTNVLPEKTKQGDFIKSIQTMFNLYFIPDGENNFRIEPRDLYLTTNNELKNWTNKLYTNINIEIESGNELINEGIGFKYASDDDFYTSTYFDTNQITYGEYYRTGKNNKEDNMNEVLFGVSQMRSTNQTQTDTFPYTTLFALQPEEPRLLKDKQFKPRILFHKLHEFDYINSSRRFTIVPSDLKTWDETKFWTPEKYFYTGHLSDFGEDLSGVDDLLFSKPISTEFYFTGYTDNQLTKTFYGRNITDIFNENIRLITAYFNLSPSDIKNFNYNDIIQVNNSRFFVNKIVDYRPYQPTKVELIRIADVEIDGSFETKNPRPTDPGIINPGINTGYLDLIEARGYRIGDNSVLNINLIDANGIFIENSIDLVDAGKIDPNDPPLTINELRNLFAAGGYSISID